MRTRFANPARDLQPSIGARRADPAEFGLVFTPAPFVEQVVERHAELQREYERKEEDRQLLSETRALQQEEAAEEELAVHVEAEEAGEEVEAVVRELRMEAQEEALREMEGALHTLHITAIKEDKRHDAQVERDERRFMQTVEELQELALEAEEGRRREEGQALFDRRVVLEEEGMEAIELEEAQAAFRLRRCSEAEKRYLDCKVLSHANCL